MHPLIGESAHVLRVESALKNLNFVSSDLFSVQLVDFS